MKRVFIFALFLSLFGSFGVSVNAQDTCDCWCTSGEAGAQRVGGTAETAVSPTTQACREACQDQGEAFVGCYEDGLTPGSIGTCWTQYECDQSALEIDGELVSYDWGGQHPDCLPGEGQCFAPRAPIDLIINIGELEEVEGLGQYLNALIEFGIIAGSVLSIIMFMIAGVMWMLARGNATRVANAKGRLKQAVTGLIIMMTMVAMAELVAPDLVNWDPLRTPAVKQLSLLDPSSTCDALMAAGFDISYTGGTDCGDAGIVVGIPDGVESTVVLNQECRFSGCSDSLAHCIGSESIGSDESGYTCVRCNEAFDATETLGLSDSSVKADPSDYTCRSLSNKKLNTGEQKYFCEYYDAGVISDFTTDSCVELVYPSGSDYVDCIALARDEQLGCRAYDRVIANYRGGEGLLKEYISFFEGADEDFALLGSICESNPCLLAPAGESCELSVVDEFEDCDVLEGAVERGACYAALTSVGTFANCANSSSNLGVENCLDKSGQPVDCNYVTW